LLALATVGVVRVLGYQENMEPIPDSEMQAVERLMVSQAPLSPHSFLKAVDRVLVKRGPLAGTEGFLVRLKNQARIVISVNLLARSASAEVDIDDVERVKV
jgi:transcription antitermination factor NusG